MQSTQFLFGVGGFEQLPHAMEKLGSTRALLVSSYLEGNLSERSAEILADRLAAVFDVSFTLQSLDMATELAETHCIDCVVAVGGARAIDVGKGVAVCTGLPLLAVPTTYAGAELSPGYWLDWPGEGRTGLHPQAVPQTVIYDPALTSGFPRTSSMLSGMGAIARGALAATTCEMDETAMQRALDGVSMLALGLPAIRRDPGDMDARTDALYGAWRCAEAAARACLSPYNALCAQISTRSGLRFAAVSTAVLPHMLAYMEPAAPVAMGRIAQALGADANTSAARAALEFARLVGAPVALRDLGMPQRHVARTIDFASQLLCPQPRPSETASVSRMIEDAYVGRLLV